MALNDTSEDHQSDFNVCQIGFGICLPPKQTVFITKEWRQVLNFNQSLAPVLPRRFGWSSAAMSANSALIWSQILFFVKQYFISKWLKFATIVMIV